ncbi:MAG: tetratricopeptide repeat protein [Candidatus Krumholzibacteria bacterium]|nr:tetratricopeptide repeat protein [Candidatus Krumholzibacteria bacterium]
MVCPKCSAENPDLARFCHSCGEALDSLPNLDCPNCGYALPENARYCTSCGCPVGKASESVMSLRGSTRPAGFLERMMPKEYLRQLMATKGRVAGERRIVTILFFDIADSTRIAESLDPEDVLEIMNGAFEVLLEPIYRYEGTLARLMGDGILSFFGAPIAHEDDPIRACHAGLEIVDRARGYADLLKRVRGIENFEVRVGINTGLVVVGEVGADLRVEYTAMGDAVNLAARMESAAEPGSVLITDNTRRLIGAVFETEDLGEIRVKGKVQPVHVFRLLRRRASPVTATYAVGEQSPLVGRQSELEQLRNALQDLQEGIGGAVAVVGETGLGKTRLISESRELQNDTCIWAEGRCMSYETGISYWIVRWILRGLLGADMLSGPREVARSLEESLERFSQTAGKSNDNVQSDLSDSLGLYPYLARLLDLPVDPSAERIVDRAGAEQLRRQISRAFCQYVRLRSQESPVVLVWEDLHWADPYSLQVLKSLISITNDSPVLLLLTFRPDEGKIREVLDGIAQDVSCRYKEVRLHPLPVDDSISLLQNLVSGRKLPDEVLRAILDCTEGNAFFLEEVLRSLLDAGVIGVDADHVVVKPNMQGFDIPTTVRGAIMSRVDQLHALDKRALQTASVIGRAFPCSVLSRVVGSEVQREQMNNTLDELRRRNFVRARAADEPRSGKPDHQVGDKRSGHAARPFGTPRYDSTVRRMAHKEAMYVFNHSMTAEVVYKSLLKSDRREIHRRTGLAIEKLFPDRIYEVSPLLAYHFERGKVADKAFDYTVRAARRAARVYANQEAVERYRAALAIEGTVADDAVAAVHEELGDVLFVMSEYADAIEQYDRALTLVGEGRHAVTLKRKKGQLYEKWGKYDEAERYFEAALDDLREPLDTTEAARIYSGLGMAFYHRGELDVAKDHLKVSLDMMNTLDDQPGVAEVCNNLGVVYCKKCDWSQSSRYLDQSLSIWRDKKDPYGLAATYNNLGLVRHRQGDLDRALELFQKSLELFNQLGNLHGLARTYDNLSQLHMDREDKETAMEFMKKAVAILAEISVDQSEILPEMWQSGAW